MRGNISVHNAFMKKVSSGYKGKCTRISPIFWLLLFACLITTNALAAPSDHFVTTWKTDNHGTPNNTSIAVPMVGGPFDVDWDNDGTFDEFGLSGSVTHDYGLAGTYTIRIAGDYDSISFGNVPGPDGGNYKILSIDQWGTNSWTTMEKAFRMTWNLQVPATDTPDFSAVTSMWAMFSNAPLANPDTTNWDTSSVTNMVGMFAQAHSANPDTSNWNTSSVTSMAVMFSHAISANPDTSNWDTSAVTNMAAMFEGATSANPDTSGWNTSAVTNMSFMFVNTVMANPDTSGWDTSAVTDMTLMFSNAAAANPDVSGWDTSMVTSMRNMFRSVTSFDQDIGSWDVTSLTNAEEMFYGVTLSTTKYENLLVGWNAQTLQNYVTFSGGDSKYCSDAAIAAKVNMMASHGWNITDGGPSLSCPPDNPTTASDLTPETDTGTSDSDDFTLDNTPDFFVNCSATDIIITLYTDHPSANTAVGNHTCVGAGTEIASVTTSLSGGIHNITYTQKNGNGESGQSPALPVTVDLLFKEGFEISVQ